MAENVGYGREAPKKRGKIAVGHKTNDDALLLSRVHAASRKESGAVAKLGEKNAAHLGERGLACDDLGADTAAASTEKGGADALAGVDRDDREKHRAEVAIDEKGEGDHGIADKRDEALKVAVGVAALNEAPDDVGTARRAAKAQKDPRQPLRATAEEGGQHGVARTADDVILVKGDGIEKRKRQGDGEGIDEGIEDVAAAELHPRDKEQGEIQNESEDTRVDLVAEHPDRKVLKHGGQAVNAAGSKIGPIHKHVEPRCHQRRNQDDTADRTPLAPNRASLSLHGLTPFFITVYPIEGRV